VSRGIGGAFHSHTQTHAWLHSKTNSYRIVVDIIVVVVAIAIAVVMIEQQQVVVVLVVVVAGQSHLPFKWMYSCESGSPKAISAVLLTFPDTTHLPGIVSGGRGGKRDTHPTGSLHTTTFRLSPPFQNRSSLLLS